MRLFERECTVSELEQILRHVRSCAMYVSGLGWQSAYQVRNERHTKAV